MQSIFQPFRLRLAFDKFLYSLQLIFTPCLKSAGVMENVAIVVREDEFVVDLVLATLQAGISFSAIAENTKPVKPLLWGRIEPG